MSTPNDSTPMMPAEAAHNRVGSDGGFGKRLSEVTDVIALRQMADRLWSLLDDIDTADDIAKSNDAAYRKLVRNRAKARGLVLESDGFNLYLPNHTIGHTEK